MIPKREDKKKNPYGGNDPLDDVKYPNLIFDDEIKDPLDDVKTRRKK